MPTSDEQRDCESSKKRKKREGVSNVRNFEEFKKKILWIEIGEKITPKKIQMQDQRRNFYNWVKLLDNVEKINGEYRRVA